MANMDHLSICSSCLLCSEEASRPQQVTEGVWNCSSHNWPSFRPHLWCNLLHECWAGQDESQCYHEQCQQIERGFKVRGRCYLLVQPPSRVSYAQARVDCTSRGGYLVSFNTDAEMEAVTEVLWPRGRQRYDIYVGLETAPVDQTSM